MYLIIFELLLISLTALIFITQILYPLVTGSKLFPMFRKNRKVILSEIEDLTEQLEVASLLEEKHNLENKIKE